MAKVLLGREERVALFEASLADAKVLPFRQHPELQRRNATPSDKMRTVLALRSPTKSNE